MKDRTVVVLESRAGPQLLEALARRGARTLWAPALRERPDVDRDEIRQLIADWGALSPALVVFQTGVGTAALFETTDSLALSDRWRALLHGTIVAARGPKPTVELARRGVRIDLAAASPFTTHEILDAIRDVPIAERTVLVQRYGETNRGLMTALRERGAWPREIATYRWSIPADRAPLEHAIEAIIAGQVDAVAFTSAAQAHNLLRVAADGGRAAALIASLNATLVASIGPVCSAALHTLGAPARLEASPPKLGFLVAALEAALGDSA